MLLIKLKLTWGRGVVLLGVHVGIGVAVNVSGCRNVGVGEHQWVTVGVFECVGVGWN